MKQAEPRIAAVEKKANAANTMAMLALLIGMAAVVMPFLMK